MIDGEPWFVAKDVCRALSVAIRGDGSVNTNAALSKLETDEKANLPYREAKQIGLQLDASRAYGVSIVSESGLYRLIMRSDKPEARAFQDWGTRDVLPAIRKDGGIPQNPIDGKRMKVGELSGATLNGHGLAHRVASSPSIRGSPDLEEPPSSHP